MSSSPTQIEFYWRPMCGSCMALERRLDRHGIAVTKRNIWSDPTAATHVRSVAGGDETVPTVTVGERSLVNRSIGEVVNLLVASAPHLLPEEYESPDPSRIDRVMGRLFCD
jgi:mycoredoxin